MSPKKKKNVARLLKNTQSWGKRWEDDFHIRCQASDPLFLSQPCHKGTSQLWRAASVPMTLFTFILLIHLPLSSTSSLSPWLQDLPLTFLILVEPLRLHFSVHLPHSYVHCTSSSENICKFSNQTISRIRDKLPGLPPP